MNDIKRSTGIIYSIVKGLRAESAFILLAKAIPFFRKFIPQASCYLNSDIRVVQRGGVKYRLKLSDYMQWHIFADMPDLSWTKAKDFLGDNTLILDIGANSGAFCLRIARKAKQMGFHNCKVFAFEPNPFILEQLKYNLELNPELKDIVEIYPFGLGDEEATLPFEFEPDNSGNGRFSDISTKGLNSIQIRKLDNFIREKSPSRIGFIKIDVEGYEPLVLKGAMETIRTYKPALFIEITDKWFREKGYSAGQILASIEEEGYNLMADTDHALTDIKDHEARMKVLSINQFNLFALSGQGGKI